MSLTLVAAAHAKEINVRIRAEQAGLLRSPSYDAEVIRLAKQGEEFVAVTTVKEFYLVRDEQTGSFLYVPFVAADEFLPLPKNVLVSGAMPMPEHEDLSYWQVAPSEAKPMRMMNLNSRSKGGMLTAHNGKRYPASYEYNTTYRPVTNGRKIVQDAMRYLGTPYVYGGSSLAGIDCSGLTSVCLARQGLKLPHRSSLQALSGRYIPHENLAAGDLLFFRDGVDSRYLSHVGIYVGNGLFIHASMSSGSVVVSKLSEDYFRTHYGFARRF